MPRRRYFGSIDSLGKDSSGTKIWRIRWRDNGKRRSKCIHGPYADAERELAKIHATIKRRTTDGPTMGELYNDYYVKTELPNLAKSTQRVTKTTWGSIEQRWGNVLCCDVTAHDVNEWVQTINPYMARRAIIILRYCLRKAAMMGYIDSSPLDMHFDVPQQPQRLKRTVLNADNIGMYHDAVKDTEIEAAWILAVAGGLRPGESLAIMTGEIEYRAIDGTAFAAVYVQREADDKGSIVVDHATGEPRLKTASSHRWAIIREPWASRLVELQHKAASDGFTYLCDDGFGNPIGTRRYHYVTKRQYQLHGLEQIPPRNLRATFATMAHHDDGLSTEDIARLMGHSKPVITWSVYERPNLDQIAAKVIKG